MHTILIKLYKQLDSKSTANEKYTNLTGVLVQRQNQFTYRLDSQNAW